MVLHAAQSWYAVHVHDGAVTPGATRVGSIPTRGACMRHHLIATLALGAAFVVVPAVAYAAPHGGARRTTCRTSTG